MWCVLIVCVPDACVCFDCSVLVGAYLWHDFSSFVLMCVCGWVLQLQFCWQGDRPSEPAEEEADDGIVFIACHVHCVLFKFCPSSKFVVAELLLMCIVFSNERIVFKWAAIIAHILELHVCVPFFRCTSILQRFHLQYRFPVALIEAHNGASRLGKHDSAIFA